MRSYLWIQKTTGKFEMSNILKQYHTITKVKVELDQFMEGLETMRVLNMVKQQTKIKYFSWRITRQTKLTRGKETRILQENINTTYM